MTQRARIERKSAPLDSEFGRSMVARWFSADQIATIPTHPNGSMKGWIVWDKVVEGGWVVDGPGEGNGHVALPGTRNVRVEINHEPFISSTGRADTNAQPIVVAKPVLPQPAPAPAPVVLEDEGIRRIRELFALAKSKGLKSPKIRLLSTGGAHGAQKLVVKAAGPSSRHTGQLLVTDQNGYGGVYFGRIDSAGRFIASESAKRAMPDTMTDVENALRDMGSDPAKTASAYGRCTGACCFCGLELTDGRSIAVGYGPICADKYGLPWGEVRAPAGTVTVTRG
jgi:hypothetical protein